MSLIKESQWDTVDEYTWGDLQNNFPVTDNAELSDYLTENPYSTGFEYSEEYDAVHKAWRRASPKFDIEPDKRYTFSFEFKGETWTIKWQFYDENGEEIESVQHVIRRNEYESFTTLKKDIKTPSDATKVRLSIDNGGRDRAESNYYRNFKIYSEGIHKWDDFYLALTETETEVTVEPIVIEHVGAEYESTAEIDVHGIATDHVSVVFKGKSEMTVDITVSDRNYFKNMLKYLPNYERNSSVFIETLNAVGYEFIETEQRLTKAEQNMFIDTAVEGLSLFERDLKISPKRELDYEQRREQISSRLRAMVDQTTEDTIKEVANAYTKGEIEINKTDEVGVFEIEFIDEIGVPDNMDGLKKALDIIFPAHLELTYKFTYNIWDDIDMTWGDAENTTWKELREDEIA